MLLAQAPPAIVQIAEHAKKTERGILVYRLHRIFDVHAGPMRRHDDLELLVASQDGTIVKVRVLHVLTGGKAADASGMAQVENQYEHPKPEDVFHRPFDPKYVGEYTYQSVDAQTYRFTSTIRDSSHGDGTFSVDSAGNVVKYQYSPYKLPPYTTSGTVTDERAAVAGDLWAVTRETHEYRGHYAIFGGGANVVITYDSFKQYPDLQSAIASLQRG